jgi:hypothetical protein
MSDSQARTRAPRGTKSVSDAFFAALLAIPEARQTEVARAAQIAIRDELKVMRDRARAAASKAKQRVAAPAPKTRGPARTKPAVAKKPTRTTRARRAMRTSAGEAEA